MERNKEKKEEKCTKLHHNAKSMILAPYTRKKARTPCDVRANYLLLLAEALTEGEEPTTETYITLLRGVRDRYRRCR